MTPNITTSRLDSPPPRIAAIHDLSGAGKCSLSIALPVLSAMGCEVCAMPTALLSTHTGNIQGFTYRDLTDDLPRIAEHWASLGLRFDAIYTGFAASTKQLAAISEAVDMLRGPDTLVLVDPVMGDHGVLYKTYTAGMIDAMRQLCVKADIITPNLTEAAMLLGIEYSEALHSEQSLSIIMNDLLTIGPKRVVVTGVEFADGQLGAAVSGQANIIPAEMSDHSKDGVPISFIKRPAIPGIWYGTGDLFASVLLGAVISGMAFADAAVMAVETTHSSIERTLRNGTDPRFGVHFEAELGKLFQLSHKYAKLD
ncbi:pyridoxal kinase [Clostridia bacterium]|nr:pyridoxal kinase [Clostridia bacterium]